ncbi:MAG: glycosyltransferase [Flavobacterium sp.]|nr:MAG: glycosyltransferase [Flavobacterium sp.]
MLSILIPTYNYNVYPLVSSLNILCNESGAAFEIIVCDDGSGSKLNIENEKINTLPNGRFIALQNNVGLSENRNTLAREAQYENLLFIDGDSIIIEPDFISNYLISLENTDVVYGGRIHPEKIDAPARKLRWRYGREVEDKIAAERNKNVYRSLLFNNALIKKTAFNKIKFDPELRQYGHEDTLFAYHASLLKLRVKHIDNAVEHGDVDLSSVFLQKTKFGLNNILDLYRKGKIDGDFVKIISVYTKLSKLMLRVPAGFFYSIFNEIMYKNLTSGNPSLMVFNIYRISYLCSLKK